MPDTLQRHPRRSHVFVHGKHIIAERPAPKKLSFIIPVYNEERTIRRVLDNLRRVRLIGHLDKEVVVVDDCSRDMTAKIIRDFQAAHPELDIKYFRHYMNKGKGAALQYAIRKCTGDFIIVQDADLEYDPKDINLLLPAMLEGHADVVFGSRYRGSGAHRILFFWHSFGNQVLTFISNFFANLNLTDMNTCYKLFRADVLKSIRLKETRFGFDPEVTAKVARIPGIRIYEVGINYFGRTFKEGKKIGLKDAFRSLYCMIKYKYAPYVQQPHPHARATRHGSATENERSGQVQRVDV